MGGRVKQAGKEGWDGWDPRTFGKVPLDSDGATGAELVGGDDRGRPGGLVNSRGVGLLVAPPGQVGADRMGRTVPVMACAQLADLW
jgi:hypothetical protein